MNPNGIEHAMEKTLNDLGKNKWELVGVVGGTGGSSSLETTIYAFLKRELFELAK